MKNKIEKIAIALHSVGYFGRSSKWCFEDEINKDIWRKMALAALEAYDGLLSSRFTKNINRYCKEIAAENTRLKKKYEPEAYRAYKSEMKDIFKTLEGK